MFHDQLAYCYLLCLADKMRTEQHELLEKDVEFSSSLKFYYLILNAFSYFGTTLSLVFLSGLAFQLNTFSSMLLNSEMPETLVPILFVQTDQKPFLKRLAVSKMILHCFLKRFLVCLEYSDQFPFLRCFDLSHIFFDLAFRCFLDSDLFSIFLTADVDRAIDHTLFVGYHFRNQCLNLALGT